MNTKNICIAGHANVGKTSLGEAILFKAGVTNRLGSIEKETSILDYMRYEKERKLSVSLSVASFEYKDIKFDIIDTPGYLDFQGDMISALHAADSVVIVVDGTSGIDFTTEKILEIVSERKTPRLFFINKLDKEDADFYKIYEEIKGDVGDGVLPLSIPIKEGTEIKGIIDLLEQKAYSKDKEIDMPDFTKDKSSEYRGQLIESLAEVDMELMEKFIEEEQISKDDIYNGLYKGFIEGKVYPVLAGVASSLIGIDTLLDYFIKIFPTPNESHLPPGVKNIDEPTVAYVFKTKFEPHVGEINFVRVWSGKLKVGSSLLNNTTGQNEKINQVFRPVGNDKKQVDELDPGSIGVLVKLRDTNTSDTLTDPSHPLKIKPIEFPNPVAKVAISIPNEKEEDKVSKGLSKLQKADPTLNSYFDSEAKQLIIESMGEQHMQLMKTMLEEQFGATVVEARPRIHYRETILKNAEGWSKFKKQTGGRGQYGEVYLKIEPLERGKGVEFVDEVKGGHIPAKFIPSVETGVKAAANEGFLARYPVIDLKIIVYDGSYHPVDSSDAAFQRAGSIALKDALKKASPFLLEPILKVKVIIPDEYTGDVMGDLNSRRGKILGMGTEGKYQVVNAYVPEREMFKYSSQLRSITQGTGTYTSEFAFYERIPGDISDKILEESKESEEQ